MSAPARSRDQALEPGVLEPGGVLQLGFAGKESTVGQCLLRNAGDDTPIRFVYSLWALPREDGVILVDTGFREEVARRRGIDYLCSPVEALAGVGITPADVTDVVLTHLHFDHAGCLGDFPSARVHVQRADLDFYTGPAMRFPLCSGASEPADLAALAVVRDEGRLHLLDGSTQLFEDVWVHLVGGHTPGSQVVEITRNGHGVVLASDVAHVYENLERAVPFPVLHDLPGCCEAFETVGALAAAGADVVPGHDGRVLDRYPLVSSASGPRVVRLL